MWEWGREEGRELGLGRQAGQAGLAASQHWKRLQSGPKGL